MEFDSAGILSKHYQNMHVHFQNIGTCLDLIQDKIGALTASPAKGLNEDRGDDVDDEDDEVDSEVENVEEEVPKE